MGKHKPGYTAHVDTGDFVIVLNVERICFTGKDLKHPSHPYFTTKMKKKEYVRFSGYAAGRIVRTAAEVWERHPDRILQEAVRRMLPKNKLGRHMLEKLKLYVGGEHPHQAQGPKPLPAHLMPKKSRKRAAK
jgi:large subunit ribosomal protein L13